MLTDSRHGAGLDGAAPERLTVRRILRPLEPVGVGDRCRHVMRQFLSDIDLYALPVVDADMRPVGMVARKHFIEFFSKPFTVEVFGPRTVLSLLTYKEYETRDPLVVEQDSGIEEVARLVIEAGMQHLATGFLVVENGRYLGIANVHDLLRIITERNDVVLKESEARARSIVEVGFDGVMTHDKGVILDANQRFAQLFGYDDPTNLVGLDAFDILFDPATRESLRVHSLAGAVFRPLEIQGLRKDGTTFSGEMQSCDSVYLGKPVRTVAIRDLTERKRVEADRTQLEAQLRESQKMEALGTLAGGVAHDFNNALAMIMGNVELARQDVGAAHPAMISLDEIDKAARRARDLVQQILAFGRRQKLERKATSLALIVAETARLIRATLPATVNLMIRCEANTPAVLADATQINQILLNLCANASQALQDVSRPGEIGAGEIEVKVSAYEKAEGAAPTALRAGRYVCLTVRDNGPGMDERVRSRIFEPFFTTKPVGKGTGLGLAVVHGIVQEHEASIEVESVVGQGSLFRICFPAIEAPAEVAAPARPEAPAIDGARKHVLFVDDEEAIVYLLKRLLGRLGFVVSGFTDPRQALEAIAANPRGFDLVVTDYNMPGMSGLDVAGAVRAIRPELPVIMASGFISDDLLEKAPLAGVTRLIYKPNTADQLCEAIADLLRKTEPAAAAS